MLLLIASFMIAYQNIPREPASNDGGTTQVFRRIFAATYLFSFTWWELVALAPLLGALAISAVAALRRITSGDLMWPVFFVLVLLVSLLNLKIGPAPLSERLAPFSGIAIVMTIAGRQPGAALVRTLCIAALAGLIGQSAVRSLAYKSWAPTLESELAAGRANPGKTFANLDLIAQRDSKLFGWRVRPTLHAAQTVALAARGAGLSSPLPSTRYFGYFPLQYVEARDFMRSTDGLGRRSRSRCVGKIPHRQPGRTASPDRVVFQRRRIGVGQQARLSRLHGKSHGSARNQRVQGSNRGKRRAGLKPLAISRAANAGTVRPRLTRADGFRQG